MYTYFLGLTLIPKTKLFIVPVLFRFQIQLFKLLVAILPQKSSKNTARGNNKEIVGMLNRTRFKRWFLHLLSHHVKGNPWGWLCQGCVGSGISISFAFLENHLALISWGSIVQGFAPTPIPKVFFSISDTSIFNFSLLAGSIRHVTHTPLSFLPREKGGACDLTGCETDFFGII